MSRRSRHIAASGSVCTDAVVPTIAIAAASSSPWNTGTAIAQMPSTTMAFDAIPACLMPSYSSPPPPANAANTLPWADVSAGSREPVRTLMRTSRSVLSSTRTTTGASPSQIESTTVSFTSSTSRSTYGPATLMIRRPASAEVASSTIRGPSV